MTRKATKTSSKPLPDEGSSDQLATHFLLILVQVGGTPPWAAAARSMHCWRPSARAGAARNSVGEEQLR